MSKKLTLDYISLRTRNTPIDKIKTLNLWGQDFEDISVLNELQNLEIVSLSVNKIKSLEVFKSLSHIKELHLRKNFITDINEIKHLKNLKNLRVLSLKENPLCEEANYRDKVLEALPFLTKLDDVAIKDIPKTPNQETKKNNDFKREQSLKEEKKIKGKEYIEEIDDNQNNPFNNNIQNDLISSKEPNEKIKQKGKSNVNTFRKFNSHQIGNNTKQKENEMNYKQKKQRNVINEDVEDKEQKEQIEEKEETQQEDDNANDKKDNNEVFQKKSIKASYFKSNLTKNNNQTDVDLIRSADRSEELQKPQYKKKIIGKFNSNPSIGFKQQKSKMLFQSQQNKTERYVDEEEEIIEAKEEDNVVNINKVNNPAKGNHIETVIKSIKILLTTLDINGLKEIQNEINKLMSSN